MLEKTADKLNSTAETIRKHRAKIAVVTAVTTMLWLDRKRVAQWNEFLTEHNLLDTFYTLD